MATSAISYRASANRNAGYGSVKSTRSLAGLSIFQDPEAGSTLPRDEEMTFMMYESEVDDRNKGTARSISQVVSQRSSDVSNYNATYNGSQNEDRLLNGDLNASDKDGGSYTFTYSHTDEGVSEETEPKEPQKAVSAERQPHDGGSSPERKNVTERLLKSGQGSFQMKSAFGVTQVSRTSSAASNQTLKDDTFKSNLDDTLTRKLKKNISSGQHGDSPLDRRSPQLGSAFNGGEMTDHQQNSLEPSSKTNGFTSESYVHESVQSSTSKKGSYDIEQQGQSNDGGNLSQSNGSKSGLSKRDSDLTSVSSLTSYSFGDSLQKNTETHPNAIHASEFPDSPAASNSGGMTPIRAASRSESQRSDSKSLSKTPSLISIDEKSVLTVTEVYSDNQRGKGELLYSSTGSDNTSSLGRQSSSMSSESSKTSTVRMGRDRDSEKSLVLSTDRKPTIPKVSSQSSIVQNKEFRDKMSSLFSSSGASVQRADATSLNSSASSTIARGHDKTYRNDMHLEINSHTQQQPEKVLVRPAYSELHSATYPRAGHDDNRPISPEPLSPVFEMQSTIKTGTVGSLVKDKFKNLNLTGRSLDRSTLKTQKSTTTESLDHSESRVERSAEQKQYKFLIEGIDYPEREAPEVEHVKEISGEGDHNDSSSDSVESSFSVKKRKELSKKGFSYVLDKQLASAIIKKAEDVTSRRPHEAVEVKTTEESHQEKPEESEILVEAKSKLKHEDSFTGRRTDYRSKQPLPISLLRDIKSRLGQVPDGGQRDEVQISHQVTKETKGYKEETEQAEEVIEVVVTPTKVERKDVFSTSMNDSILSSVTTITSSQNIDGTETTMTSSETLDGGEISSQGEVLPVSEKKLIYDGFNYEIRHSGLLEGEDAPKSYSQLFQAQVKKEPSQYARAGVSHKSEIRTSGEYRQTSSEGTGLLMRQTSPSESFIHSEGEPVEVESMQKMPETVTIRRDDVTSVTSLREHSKEGGLNTVKIRTIPAIEITQPKQSSPVSFRNHAMESDTDSSVSTPPLKSPNFPIFDPLPSPGFVVRQVSVEGSDESVQEEYISPAKRNDHIRTVLVEEPQQPSGVSLAQEPVGNSTVSAQHSRVVTHHTNKSFGTFEVKETTPPLKKKKNNNNRAASGQERHSDLPDAYTKETHGQSGVTLERKTTRRGGGERLGSELYIGVTGGSSKQQRVTETLHTSLSTNKQQPRELRHNTQDLLFYSSDQPHQLVSNSAPVLTERLGKQQGQLYTSVQDINTSREPVQKSPRGPKSPRGGVLYVRHNNTGKQRSPQSDQPSPHYSTSSGPVSPPPPLRQEIFYQPPPQRSQTTTFQGHTGRAVSRSSSSSAIGSVNSFQSEGVYVYRSEGKPQGRTLKDLNELKVVHLKPLRVSTERGDGHRVLKTHPTFYSPHDSTVTSPVYLSDVDHFETSNMMGTSTLRPNMDPNYMQMGRDENMNYKGNTKSRRFLTVDEISGGRVPIHRGMQVSTINIDNDHNDTHSGHSEPVMARRNKYHVQKVMDTRRAGKQFATPLDMHPDMAFKKQKFYSVSRNVEHKSPEIQVELDPHLEEAHKTGNQYNVTMKLNASTIALPSNSSAKDLFQEEYIEESLYQNNNNNPMRSPPPQMISPGVYSSRSTSDDSAILSPGNRSKTNITLIEDHTAPQPPVANPSTVEHMRFTQYMGNPPRVVTTATTPVGMNDNEPRLRPSTQHMPLQQRADPGYPGNSTNNAVVVTGLTPTVASPPPKFSMSIDQTMTMDYVMSDDQEINNNSSSSIRPQRVNTVDRQYVSPEPPTYRRNVPQQHTSVMDTQRMVNGDVYTYNGRSNGPNPPDDNDDDLEQYLSPAEEDPIEPSRAKRNKDGKGYPQVVRGSILIKNAMDTTGAPKVFDVVEGDTESDEDTLINDNVNPFHGHYFQARENPMYSSDPDLRAERERNRPQFTQIFEQNQRSSASQNHSGRSRDYTDNEDFDTEIKVTRVDASQTGSPKKKSRSSKQQSSESTSYVYNGYDQTDRGGQSSSSSGRKNKVLSHSEKTESQISRLLKDAPPESIKQTINVEREEEEILGPLPEGDDGAGPDSLLNFDTISEKVDLGMKDGAAQVAVKVRCERVVPIRGVDDMFKKSCVIVTRLIEIDLLVTEERRKLYEYITESSQKSVTAGGDAKSRSSKYGQSSKLSTKETFKLYKTFMGMAEAADEGGKSRDNIRIDRQVEEKRRPEVQAEADILDMDMDDHVELEFDTDALERQLEDQLIAHAMRAPEPDTISYLSAASENASILY